MINILKGFTVGSLMVTECAAPGIEVAKTQETHDKVQAVWQYTADKHQPHGHEGPNAADPPPQGSFAGLLSTAAVASTGAVIVRSGDRQYRV